MFLSRACLGKKMTFMYKWLKPPVFLPVPETTAIFQCGACSKPKPKTRQDKTRQDKTRQNKTTGSKLNQMTNSIVQIQPSLSLPLWLPARGIHFTPQA